MFREFAVLLCIAGIVSAGRFRHRYSGTSSTTAAPLQVSSVANAIPIETKPLQIHEEVTLSPDAFATQEHVAQYISSEQGQVSSPGVTYSISPAVVKTISAPAASSVAVPVDNKVTVEAHQQVTAHPPKATPVTIHSAQVVAQPVQYHVQTVVSPQTVPLVHVKPKPIVTVTTHPSTATAVTSTLPPQPIQYVHQVAHTPTAQYIPVAHGVVNTNTVSAVPAPAQKVTVEAHRSVTVHPPTIPRTFYHPVQTIVNPPAVEIVSSSVAQNPIPATSGIYETVTAHPPSAAYVNSLHQPFQHVQTIVNRPTVHYFSPEAQVKPVLIKSNPATVEAHQSVISHPPRPVQQVQTVIKPAPVQYVSTPVSTATVTKQAATLVHQGSSQVHYAPLPTPSKPVSVPVIYTAEEAQRPQYITVTTDPRLASTVLSQSIPLAYPRSSFIKYSTKMDTPLVYTKSIVQKDHSSADLLATRIAPNYGGYARAVAYSPASLVSRVSFNGLGTSYTW